MGVSKQMTFTLACAVVLSALIPGLAGYLSARLEAIESAERSLRALETRLHIREARDARPVSYPGPCLRTPAAPGYEEVPAAALGQRRHWQPDDVTAWLPGLVTEPPYAGGH
ncbi:hypothetical protein [Nonomuraea sp. B1E8]|uniref:hypothetical protein n=1 Tax=unclassified Nonomuraea TaxID=2593643 RepID=UPI00325DAA21